MHLNGITLEQAEEKIEKADKKRAAYYNYYSYKTWGAAATYHLCVDSSVMGIDKTVEYILHFVKHKLNLE
jgi:cytidylate kinase